MDQIFMVSPWREMEVCYPEMDEGKGRPMRIVVSSWVLVALVAASFGGATAQQPMTEDQKTLYALGVAAGQGLSVFNLTDSELEMVKAGLSDTVLHKPLKAELQPYMGKIQDLQKARLAVVAAAEKKEGQAFLDKAASAKDAVKAPSGFVITTLKAGTGESPKASDKVKVHYQGTLTDGTVFDSSFQRGEPVTFPLNGVIRCWTEGVQMMKVGGKSRLVCPSDLAYGERGAPPRIKPGATLVFEVELLEIVK
jgi:FKBP-type peptidyl-prolyl cis-trans isomerase FkpA/FKBP-type peptidyl-prolyl cis-trans isomerase FklB